MQAFRRVPVVVILGATGAGKSKLALEIGGRFNGEIISADSMQVYKGLDIITNKVSAEEQDLCAHHLLGIVHPLQRFTVVDFRNLAIPIIDALLNKGKMPIIVGGTNYYIESLIWKVLLSKEETVSQQLLYETKGEVKRLKIKRRKHFHHSEHDGVPTKISSENQVNLPSPLSLSECRHNDISKCVHRSNLIVPGRIQSKGGVDQSQDGVANGVERTAKLNMVPAISAQSGSMAHGQEVRTTESDGYREASPLELCEKHARMLQTGESNLAAGQSAISSGVSGNGAGGNDVEEVDVILEDTESVDLHQLLSQVDPQMASKLHPNDRRKVIRSLQVYEQHGVPHSQMLDQQKSQAGGSHLGGPLRYSNLCVFWVQCEQSVLDARLDKRVDEMMAAGLLTELEDFHKDYNEQRLAGHLKEQKWYTQGIFQSIGFKEFHQYLLMRKNEKMSDRGQHLVKESIEILKTATRQYARRQLKWVRNRFLKRGGNSPPVYGLDSTNPEKWSEYVLNPAQNILQEILEGREPSVSPLVHEEPEESDLSQTFVCKVCNGRQFVGHHQWSGHLKSRRHCKQARKRKLRELTGHNIRVSSTPALAGTMDTSAASTTATSSRTTDTMSSDSSPSQ